ncbi:MAG: hypothetical protein HQ462_07265 [Deltaproteobacteria bacterium]|nr:hypothetical protein [Deltaproteobacteria bacterium]
MNRTFPIKLFSMIAVMGIVLIEVGCGGKGNNNPAPAPGPSTPAPLSPGFPGIAGSNCPLNAGGVPLNTNGSPFSGSLQSRTGGQWGGSNSINLALSFLNYSGPGGSVQTLAGAGALLFPDLASILKVSNNTNYNICVSSNNNNVNTGANPGTYNMRDGSISLTLVGTIQVPLYNPFNNYPGSYQTYPNTQTSPETLRLNIGLSCPTYVNNNRIYGCVDIKVGTSPYGPVYSYYSR